MSGKQLLVGTTIGPNAQRGRDAIERHLCNLQNLGTLANDQIAEFLVNRLAERHFVDVGAHIGSIIADRGEQRIISAFPTK